MKRFIEGEDLKQVTVLAECLDDYIGEDNPVRVVDVFVEEIDLLALGFAGADQASTGRPAYHPAVLLKLYIYGYLHRIQSSRRLERQARLPHDGSHSLLLPKALRRRQSSRPHDGKVAVTRSDMRWCSDGFEIKCDSCRLRRRLVRWRSTSGSKARKC